MLVPQRCCGDLVGPRPACSPTAPWQDTIVIEDGDDDSEAIDSVDTAAVAPTFGLLMAGLATMMLAAFSPFVLMRLVSSRPQPSPAWRQGRGHGARAADGESLRHQRCRCAGGAGGRGHGQTRPGGSVPMTAATRRGVMTTASYRLDPLDRGVLGPLSRRQVFVSRRRWSCGCCSVSSPR